MAAPLLNEELCPKANFVPYHPNNYYIDFKALSAEHGVMLEILKGHPISYALRSKTWVPEIYIQELWKYMTYHEDDGTPCIRGTINRVLVKITKKTIRTVLKFPKAYDREGMDEFEPFVNEEELTRDVRSLGYEADSPFTAPSHFKKRRLAALWSTLFTPINRCMTWKKAGQDKCSVDTLTFFHGIAFDRHYDFAELIWKDLVSLVKDKDQREFVPFIRFIKLIIANFMKTHPEIIVRPYENCPVDTPMHRLQSNCGHRSVPALRIPDELLAYADPRAQVVNEYRLAYPSLVLAQPLKPTQEGRLDGEVRIECDGAGEPEAELATRALNIKGSSAGNEANEGNIPEGGGVNDTIGVEKKKRKREKLLKAKNDRDKRHSKKKSDGSHTESVSRASTTVDPSSANTPVLMDNIETDISRPLMHAPTPPIYLDTSLEVSISSRLVAKSHEPPHVPPSTVGIEKEDVLLRSSPPKSVSLDENDDVVRMYANIHEDSTDDGLQDLATTAALVSKPGTFLGSAGNPAGVSITKAPTSGHLVESSSRVRTKIPISGVFSTSPVTATTTWKPLSPVIQQHSTTTTDSTPITMSFLMSQFQSLKEHIDNKGQPSNSSDELPKDEYKKYSMDQISSMLRSKILVETNKTDTQQSLLELLTDFVHDRFHPATQENVDALHDMFQTSIDKLTSQVEKLTRELNDLRSGWTREKVIVTSESEAREAAISILDNVAPETRHLDLSSNEDKFVLGKLDGVLNIVCWVLTPLTWIVLSRKASDHVMICMGAVFTVGRFIFREKISIINQSVAFVFLEHTDDVADLVEIEGVELKVEEVNILTTNFLRHDNDKVASSTTMEQITSTEAKIISYIENEAGEVWQPNPKMLVKSFDSKVIVWVTRRMKVRELGQRNLQRDKVVEKVLTIFNEAGITMV
ncbi:hypothetical protein Tco_0287291 [Tanacetum coccineum]